jgi:hypothetical protein
MDVGPKRKCINHFLVSQTRLFEVRRSERILLGQKNPITKQNQ